MMRELGGGGFTVRPLSQFPAPAPGPAGAQASPAAPAGGDAPADSDADPRGNGQFTVIFSSQLRY